jgi:penicillin amidase
MRIWPFITSALVTGSLVAALSTSIDSKPAFGPLLDPQEGFWQNADPANMSYSMDLHFQELSAPVKVYVDRRLVPHIFAENEKDAYFAQGYIHARFRLWQMDIQTDLADGRLTEVVGRYSGNHDLLELRDRYYRRLGMGYAAEQALKGMEADSATKAEVDAYTEGVNAYISSLTIATMPLEYKLLNYAPEPWTNLKCALLLKMMSYDLAGEENDFQNTNARNLFSASDFQLLYPSIPDSIDPIVPEGTQMFNKRDTPGVRLKVPVGLDTSYFMTKSGMLTRTLALEGPPPTANWMAFDYDIAHTGAAQRGPWEKDPESAEPDPDNGSNNWAVSGAKTQSGAPILCNDPHLGLNLPSLWFEVQIHTPTVNVYGASLPGAPGVIIGFNDSAAFGVTNSMRDVRDYFEITFKDQTKKEYLYNGNWLPTAFRVEDIRVKGEPDYMDTVAYTVFGPVMYEPAYPDPLNSGKYYACKWAAHEVSNELLCFNKLDHAENYDQYLDAIKNLHTPGQNVVFASASGDIAVWAQGAFPAKWFRQGDFVMEGKDSAYDWQGTIPQAENPHLWNPVRGFVSSANQLPIDPKTYPYYLSGNFLTYRGMEINRRLDKMQSITTQDMMDLQTDNYDLFAEMARPLFIKYIDTTSMEPGETHLFDLVRDWDLYNNPGEKAPAIFHAWWDSLFAGIYGDELRQTALPITKPSDQTLVEALLKDSSYKFVDDIRTPAQETLRQIATQAWKKIYPVMLQLENNGNLTWSAYKDTHIDHLLKLPAFSDQHLQTGGGTNSINATKADHGPSWRMVVELTTPVHAFGIYPGGQEGNPGSPYFDNTVQDWAKGKYDTLWLMTPDQVSDSRIQWKINFTKP